MFWKKKKETAKVSTIKVTDNNFDTIVRDANVPVLLDFWAPWCGPCKVLGPFIDNVSRKYQDKAIIAKVNIDKNPMLAQKFKVKSIPTLFFIKDNVIVDGHNGLLPQPNIERILDELIQE